MEAPSEEEFLFRWEITPEASLPSDGLFIYRLKGPSGRSLRVSFNLQDDSMELWQEPESRVTLEGVSRCSFDGGDVLRAAGDLGSHSVRVVVWHRPSPSFEVVVLRVP